MREYPVFVPVGGNAHIAGVTTVPDGDASAVVVMTTGGGGVPRSHRYRLWTKVARRLANHGVASLRMEWPGAGDSTGQINMTFSSLPVSETADVASFALAATGTTRLGLLGNCGGARAALAVAASRLPCESAVLLFLKPIVTESHTKRVISNTTRKRLGARSPEWAKELVRSSRRWRGDRSTQASSIMEALERVSRGSDVLLLEHPSQQTGKMSKTVVAGRRGGSAHRFELRDLPGTTMVDFESHEDQELIVGTIVEWFVQSFSEPGSGLPTSRSASDAGQDLSLPRLAAPGSTEHVRPR